MKRTPALFGLICLFAALSCRAQLCSVTLTSLSYDQASARYQVKGQARLDGVPAPGGSVLEERLRVSVQFVLDSQGSLPMFYERWEPTSRCFTDATGCLQDGDVRGNDVQSLSLLVHSFSPEEYGQPVSFSREFAAPAGALKTRVVSQYHRVIHRPPWDRPEQEFTWQKVNEWSRDLLPELPPLEVVRVVPPPAPVAPLPVTPPPAVTPPPVVPTEVVFDTFTLDERQLAVTLSVPALREDSLLTGILRKKGQDRVLQQVQFQTGVGGAASMSFRTFRGWDGGIHEIEVYHRKKFLGKFELDFDEESTGSKLAF